MYIISEGLALLDRSSSVEIAFPVSGASRIPGKQVRIRRLFPLVQFTLFKAGDQNIRSGSKKGPSG
jgi:hypothetical protein